MSEKEKMISGELYDAGDAELTSERQDIRELLAKENRTLKVLSGRSLSVLFPNMRETATIQFPFFCDYGYNIFAGENFYANFNNTFLDVCPIHIGDNCMFGPNVQLYTATHPILPRERNSGLEYGKPITIGDNVWLGGGVIVSPGVHIGNNVIAAAGSVIVKDVPDNSVVGGNPAKVLKMVGEKMNEKVLLLQNIEKVKTTELGSMRVRRNLSLDLEDVVDWCCNKIKLPHAMIEKRGKNWYVHVDGCIVTVNASSYTIITAHKEKNDTL